MDRRGNVRAGSEPERAAPVAPGVSSVSGSGEAALVRRPGCGAGAEGGPAGAGDRFFEGVLAAHRGAADVAGTDWESAVFRKVKEKVKAGGELTIGGC